MEKMLLKEKQDLQKAIEFFGKEHKTDLVKSVNHYPCILIGNYAEDVEFGENYSFTTVVLEEFEGVSGVSYF